VLIEKSSYLQKENLNEVRTGDKVRALIRTKCGNMEESNKYWVENNYRVCVYSVIQGKIK